VEGSGVQQTEAGTQCPGLTLPLPAVPQAGPVPPGSGDGGNRAAQGGRAGIGLKGPYILKPVTTGSGRLQLM